MKKILLVTLISLFIFQVTVSAATVEVWKGPHSNNAKEIWNSLTESFTESTGIEIEFTATPWDSWDEKYTSAFAAGSPPDVSYMPDEFYPRFAVEDQLYELDEYENEFGSFYQSIWDMGHYNGHLYAVPFLQVNYLQYYNKDLFDEAGLSYLPGSEDDDMYDNWTWDTFVNYAKKLTQDTNGDGNPDQWGYGFSVSEVNPNTLYPFLWQAGVELLVDEDGDGSYDRSGMDTPEGRKGLQFLVDLVQKHNVIPAEGYHPDMEPLIDNEQLAMTMIEASTVARLKEDRPEINYGVGFNPKGPESRAAFGNVGFFTVSKDSENKEEAVEFIKHITEKNFMKEFLTKVTLFPTKDIEMFENDPKMQVFVRNGQYIKPYPIVPYLREVHDIYLNAIEQAVAGTISVEKACKQVDDKIVTLITEQ